MNTLQVLSTANEALIALERACSDRLQVFATVNEAFLAAERMCANRVGHFRVAVVTADQHSAEQAYQSQPTTEEIEQAAVDYNQRMFDSLGEPPVPPKDAICETCKGCLYNDLGERVRCPRSVGIVHEKIEQVHYTIYENCVGLCREADEEKAGEAEEEDDLEYSDSEEDSPFVCRGCGKKDDYEIAMGCVCEECDDKQQEEDASCEECIKCEDTYYPQDMRGLYCESCYDEEEADKELACCYKCEVGLLIEDAGARPEEEVLCADCATIRLETPWESCDAFNGGSWFCHNYDNCDFCNRHCKPCECGKCDVVGGTCLEHTEQEEDEDN